MGQLEQRAVPALNNLPFYDLLTDICLSLFRLFVGTVCLCFVAMHVDGYSPSLDDDALMLPCWYMNCLAEVEGQRQVTRL
jgi:hypothetical protein